MIKIIFPYQIKYKDRYIPTNVPFEADDGDKKELLKLGGKVLEVSQSTSNKNVSKGDKNESIRKT